MNRTLSRFFITALFLVPLAGWGLNDWTVIMYMSADDVHPDIEEAQVNNMLAAAKFDLPKGVEVIAQIDRGPEPPGIEKKYFKDTDDRGAFRYSLKKGSIKQEKRLGEVNLGSPYALWECLKWAVKDHPAKRYFLIFNSHGSGVFSWVGTGSVKKDRPGRVDFDPDRFVAYDDTNEDCLTVFEISAVMDAFKEKLNSGRRCDIVGFDACLTGGLETLYQLREAFDFMVTCPDETSIDGINYESIVAALVRNPKIDPAGLARVSAESSREPATTPFGAWKTAKAHDAVFALSNLSIEILGEMKKSGKKLRMTGFEDYGGDKRYWDLKKLLDGFSAGSVKLPQAGKLQLVKKLAREAADALMACRTSARGSLSIAMPKKTEYQEFRKFYKALDFSKATKWDELLDLQEK